MANSPRKPTTPPVARETIRHALSALLRDGRFSAKEISAALGIREKDVYSHLDHIRRSLQTGDEDLETTPAECRSCGFVFAKRERLTPPGKCPMCRKEAISDPLFRIVRE